MNITRRDFLKTSAGIAAIAALPGIAFAAGKVQIPEPKRSMALYFEKSLGAGKWYRVAMPTAEDAMVAMKRDRHELDKPGKWYRVAMPTAEDAMVAMKRDRHELDKPIGVLGNADLIVHWNEDDGHGEVFDGILDDEISLNPAHITKEIMAVLKKLPVTDIDTVVKEQSINPLKPKALSFS